MDITKLSEKKLQELYEKRSEKSSEMTTKMIEAGRGHELHSETIAKGKACADLLSEEFLRVSVAFCDVIIEQKYRREYHGSLKPVRHKLTRQERYSKIVAANVIC